MQQPEIVWSKQDIFKSDPEQIVNKMRFGVKF